jgi:hypothetical protein
MSAVHHHREIFSNLLIQLITKVLLNSAKIKTIEMKDGAFSISIEIKN